MGYKTLEVTIISGKDLKNVNLIGKMDVYVVVYLSDEAKNKQKTPVHQDGGTNPSWNYTIRFNVDDVAATNPGKYLIFQLRHEHSFGADKELGEVRVSIKELFDGVKGKDASAPQFLTYQVRRASGKAKGELNFSYKVVDMGQNIGAVCKPTESCSSSYAAQPQGAGAYPPPAMAGMAAAHQYPSPPAGYPDGGAYPPPPVGLPYAAGHPPYGGHPPPPAGYGYPPASGGYPPPPGGYPPPPGGYPAYPPAGYPQQVHKPQKLKKNNFGMGLGAGLLGGAIGGLVLGEMVDDAFDADCGGF